jgi:hypothetical protein
MKTYNNPIILILTLMLSTACTERIELDIDSSDPVLVIYGSITDTLAYQQIAITSSVPYFSDESNPPISGAKVQVTTSENETWAYVESQTEKGIYRTEQPKAGKQGITYYLEVVYDFDQDGADEIYEANSTLLPPFQTDSTQIRTIDYMGYNVYTINIHGQEPSGEDFYMSKFYVCDTLATTLSDVGLWNDILFDGQYLNGLLIYSFGDMTEYDKYSEEDSKYMVFVSPGDEIIVEFNHIEEKYFNFIKQAQDMRYGENPMFGGPPSNIQGNISNGAVGFFSAYSPSRSKVIVP